MDQVSCISRLIISPEITKSYETHRDSDGVVVYLYTCYCPGSVISEAGSGDSPAYAGLRTGCRVTWFSLQNLVQSTCRFRSRRGLAVDGMWRKPCSTERGGAGLGRVC